MKWMILMLLMAGSYIGITYSIKELKIRSLALLVWCAVFAVYSVVAGLTAFVMPFLGDSQWIIFAIVAVALLVVLVMNFGLQSYDSLSERLYYIWVRPIALECAFCGALMPELFHANIKALTYWLNISIFHINGIIVIVVLLPLLLQLLDSKEESWITKWLLPGCIGIFHALVIVSTQSVLIPVVLRIAYGFLQWKKSGQTFRA